MFKRTLIILTILLITAPVFGMDIPEWLKGQHIDMTTGIVYSFSDTNFLIGNELFSDEIVASDNLDIDPEIGNTYMVSAKDGSLVMFSEPETPTDNIMLIVMLPSHGMLVLYHQGFLMQFDIYEKKMKEYYESLPTKDGKEKDALL